MARAKSLCNLCPISQIESRWINRTKTIRCNSNEDQCLYSSLWLNNLAKTEEDHQWTRQQPNAQVSNKEAVGSKCTKQEVYHCCPSVIPSYNKWEHSRPSNMAQTATIIIIRNHVATILTNWTSLSQTSLSERSLNSSTASLLSPTFKLNPRVEQWAQMMPSCSYSTWCNLLCRT